MAFACEEREELDEAGKDAFGSFFRKLQKRVFIRTA